MKIKNLKNSGRALFYMMVIALSGLSSNVLAADWVPSGNDIYYDAGNVGIATTTPNQKLSVNGSIEIFKEDMKGIVFRDSNEGFVWKNAFGKPVFFSESMITGKHNSMAEFFFDTTKYAIWAYCEGVAGSAIGVDCADYDGTMGSDDYYWVWKHGIDPQYPETADLKFLFDGESNDGVMGFMEDEDHFFFDDDVVFNGTVGIGTSIPTSTVGLNKFLEIEDSLHAGIVLHDTSDNPWEIYVDGGYLVTVYNGGAAYGWVLDSAGNLGIGDILADAHLEISANGGSGGAVLMVSSNDDNDGDLFIVNEDGNVGINTKTPDYKLHVVGDGHFTGTLTADNIVAKYQDLAEYVRTSEPLTPGMVVMIDFENNNQVLPSDRAYNTLVAGVVSEMPGIILGEGGSDRAQIAHTGRVKVKVDTSNEAISRGDLLVTSSVKGYAMKADSEKLKPGMLLGKALEPLDQGKRGEILALITLQ